MVSAVDDQKATCRVIDQHPDTKQKKISFLVSPATTVTSFIQQVATQYSGYSQFELTLESQNVSNRHLNDIIQSCVKSVDYVLVNFFFLILFSVFSRRSTSKSTQVRHYRTSASR